MVCHWQRDYRLSLADEDVGADKAESNSIQGQKRQRL